MDNLANNQDAALCNPLPWSINGNMIWLASSLTLLRNIEKFNFPGKLSNDKKKQLFNLISRDLLEMEALKNPRLIKAEGMQPIEKEYLVEHFLTKESFHQASSGEGFVLEQTGESLIAINLHDHLMFHRIDINEELEAAWERICNIEALLSKSVNFSFSSKFGFLTSDPAECGTGLIVHIFMHLPGLIHTGRLEEAMKKNKDDAVEQAGLHGDPKDLIGDIVVCHNNYTLGLTEENIISMLRTLGTKLSVEEKSVRAFLKQGQGAEILELKDKISRAYAILLHSYQIEAVEALQALSLLKLGLDLDWLAGISQTKLNELFFAARRAHLLCRYGQKITQEELPHKRAEFIHNSLKGSSLLI
ncbi:MAG: protein arginine kinase [Candidatus Protochlamydia sp.]|nr:protein arginine kinase [Candidatus Protochlamydia sp.]